VTIAVELDSLSYMGTFHWVVVRREYGKHVRDGGASNRAIRRRSSAR
jgi:hypothetical protein